MNELDSIIMFAEELLALVGLLRRHLDTLRHPDNGATHATALEEFHRLTTAVADLSEGYHADDCAQVARAILRVASMPTTPFGDVPLLAPPVTQALKYLFDRASEIHKLRRVTFPTDAQLAMVPGILAGLQLASGATRSDLSAYEAAEPSSSGSGHAVIRPHRDSRPLTGNLPPPALDLPMPAILEHDSRVENVPFGDYATRAALPIMTPEPHAAQQDGIPPIQVEEDRQRADTSGAADHLTHDDWEVIRAFQSSTLKAPQPFAASPVPPAAAKSTMAGVSAEDFDEIPPEMRAFFLKEAVEDLVGLREALLQIEQTPGDRSSVMAMAHIAHKLKGSAAQFGFETLAAVTMSLEAALKALLPTTGDIQMRALADLTALVSLTQTALDGADGSDVAARAEASRDRVQSIIAAPAQPQKVAPAQGHPVEPQGATPAVGALAAGDAPLKLDVHELDQLTAQVHSLAFSRAALATATDEAQEALHDIHQAVARLRELHGRVLEGGSRAARGGAGVSGVEDVEGVGGEKGAGGYFTRLLGSRSKREDEPAQSLALERFDDFDQALRGLGEAIADGMSAALQLTSSIERLTEASNAHWTTAEAVQRDVMRLRLVPLADLLPHLRFELRRLQQATGKQVTFTVHGEETRIDRHVLDALREPITQLVRNAVVHGIEEPEERASAGKPAAGSLWLTASHEGGSVVIELGDDGRGVNPGGLVASALVAGLIPAGGQRTLSDDEALQLMFEPGVTTLPETRMVGGRGIGLDQVRAQIQRLRGTIVARSRESEGSVFTVTAPISLAMLRALLVTAGGETYAVPFDAVERTVLLGAASALAGSLPDAEGRRFAMVPSGPSTGLLTTGSDAGERLPIYMLGELLGTVHEPGDRTFALVVGNGPRRSAILVDDIVDDRESIVQALPRHLRRHSLRGATITLKGEVALVVDLAHLIERGPAETRAERARGQTQPASGLTPGVLVVDDSEAMRRSLTLPLARAGLMVETANDGIEALERMLVRRPQLVLLDIEMPRLDGFELLAAMREHEQLKTVPVVVLTSRAGDRHIAHARELGASAYLIKPCPQDELLRVVRSLLPDPVNTL